MSLVNDLAAGHGILKAHARLTEAGTHFFQAMTSWLEDLQLRADLLTAATTIGR